MKARVDYNQENANSILGPGTMLVFATRNSKDPTSCSALLSSKTLGWAPEANRMYTNVDRTGAHVGACRGRLRTDSSKSKLSQAG